MSFCKSRRFLAYSLILILFAFQQPPDFASYRILTGNSEELTFVPVKGGTFLMGPEKSSGQGPKHEVMVDDFWMGTHEITWDQYEIFLYRKADHEATNALIDIDAVSGATMPYVNFNEPGFPVICITQYAASQYCKWLTAMTGDFYRLPTEAEWEYACKGGRSGEPGSKEMNDLAWFAENSASMLHKGGLKSPNGFGLFDMNGNAAEWVIDSYKEGYSHLENPKNPLYENGELYPHVVRGGSYKSKYEEVLSTARSYSTSQWKRQDPQFPKSLWWHTDALHVGFRVVRPRNPPKKEDFELYWLDPIEEY